ncbi:uncharacterized protein LOC124313507 [Daphnia pulicaria]|uniref:uncharacterized protein LOC124313507 n=1 Tax=Daphnia pulicaria TaxID=35523 RepID=UPI001EE9F570|nr:uncharacterized protein LOC124313507 [Daphnia pulicaria]
MSRFIAVLVACVLAVMLVGVDAQGRYYFSRNAMPTIVRYQQPVQQSYPVRQNTYAAQQQYNPYAGNWARPVVSVPQQQYRPSNYYGYNSVENNSGESREVYRGYW